MITYSYVTGCEKIGLLYYIFFSQYGNTPLHLAARYGYGDVLNNLIESGANLYIKNKVNNQIIAFL